MNFVKFKEEHPWLCHLRASLWGGFRVVLDVFPWCLFFSHSPASARQRRLRLLVCFNRFDNDFGVHVTFFMGKTKEAEETYTQKMIQKIDSEAGRETYSQQMGIIEPVFANIRSTMRLDLVCEGK